jgi:hypothetical protein
MGWEFRNPGEFEKSSSRVSAVYCGCHEYDEQKKRARAAGNFKETWKTLFKTFNKLLDQYNTEFNKGMLFFFFSFNFTNSI